MCKLIIFALAAIFISGSQARVAPSYIKKCPMLKQECLKDAIQNVIPDFTKGIPELGIMPTDPLRDDNVKLELPGAFKVQLNNGTLTGLRKCVVESVSYQNDEADMVLRCNVTIRGKYKAKGNILIVTINGEGDAKIKIVDVIINAKIKFEDVTRDGVVYYDIKDLKVKQKYNKVTFSLTNLFQGNPQLSEAVLQFLNENWLQITEEFGGPIFDRLVKIIFNTVKVFFEKVPKEELY